MTLAHKIQGESMQMIVFQLDEGQRVYCEAGKFLWKTVNVTMETRLGKGGADQDQPPAPGVGGLLNKALKTGVEMGKRHLAGESVAFQHFTANGLGAGGVRRRAARATCGCSSWTGPTGWYAEKDAFVAAESTVELRHLVPGRQDGRKGGEGFVLEKFSGRRHAGDRRGRQLHRAQPGQVRRQDPGRHRLRGGLPGHDHLRHRDGSVRSTPRPW